MVAPARQATVIDMDNSADTLDQTDEDILTYTVSDEALEAAAGGGLLLTTQVTDCLRSILCC
jgi:hypothetical protein